MSKNPVPALCSAPPTNAQAKQFERPFGSDEFWNENSGHFRALFERALESAFGSWSPGYVDVIVVVTDGARSGASKQMQFWPVADQ